MYALCETVTKFISYWLSSIKFIFENLLWIISYTAGSLEKPVTILFGFLIKPLNEPLAAMGSVYI